uniref:POTRA domain-containing protein n=1 Tax=Thermosporothrix sp. COM3 TaxID=2490863 RepID=A0A455STE8_9CHLR|nr:hypothetical protein KTC_51620 [Thermosporothrix sp. COM3]
MQAREQQNVAAPIVRRPRKQADEPYAGGAVGRSTVLDGLAGSRVVRRLPAGQSADTPARAGRRGGITWKPFLFLVGIIVLLLALFFAFTSNAFQIKRLAVVGTRNPALIRSIENSGVRGRNIFLVNIPGVKEQIEALPAVASADISKQWPDQLVIHVVERRPVLLWQTPEGAWSIDREGVVVAPLADTEGAEKLPVVLAASGVLQAGKNATIRPGMRLNRAEIQFARDVFASLQKMTGIGRFQLRYDGTMYANTTSGPGAQRRWGSFRVESAEGWIAYLGSADDLNPVENKLQALERILALAQRKHLSLATIDLRYGYRPIYTVKQEEKR